MSADRDRPDPTAEARDPATDGGHPADGTPNRSGPDRRSAVPDRPFIPPGRATAVSTVVAETLAAIRLTAAVSGGAVLVAALLVGTQLLGLPLTGLAITAGASLALGLYALNSDRLWVSLVAGALLTPAAALLAATLGVGVAFAVQSGVAIGHVTELALLLLVVGSFAGVLTVVPLREEEVIAGAFMRFIGMLLPLTLVQLLVAAAVTWESTVLFLARLVVDSPAPLLAVAEPLLAPDGGGALLTLLLYPVLVVFLLRLVVGSLPLVRLFPPRQRSSISTQIDHVRSRLGTAVFVAGTVAVLAYLGAAVVGLSTPSALRTRLEPPLSGVADWLLTSVVLRMVLLVVVGGMVAILVAEQVRRRARRRSDAELLRYALPAVGAVIAAVVIGLGLELLVSPGQLLPMIPLTLRPTAEAVLASGIFPAALLGAFVSLIVVGTLFIALTLIVGSPVLPERALGPALAGTAVFGLALVLALFQGSAAVAFTAAALALIAWDTGEFATGLTEDLPAGATTLRGEVVHVGGTLTVGVLAVLSAFVLAVLIGGSFVVPSIPDPALAAGAITLAFGTAILLVSALRE